MIRVTCTCGRTFKAEDRHAGRRTKCPLCGAGLIIGSGPVSSSSGGDVEEVPSWWYPSDPPLGALRGTAPTRTGSDPGPESAQTMVLPPGTNAHAPAPVSSQVPAGRSKGPLPPPQPAIIGPKVDVWNSPFPPLRNVWLICGGALALSVLAAGAIVWLRPTIQGNVQVTPARSGGAIVKPDKTNTGVISTSDGTTLTPHSEAASGRLRLLVPAYIYPVGDGRTEWQRLIHAASKVEIVAIANPNSGPGTERIMDYSSIFTEASSKGVTLVGYVSTQYDQRPIEAIKKDIDTWIRFYPQIRGFFFDQQPQEHKSVAHFVELRDYAKRKLRDPLVITNPGVPCDEAYLAQAVSSVTCVFNNFLSFDQFELPVPLKAYEPERFAALPYNVADVETMRAVVKEAIMKRIGYLYISDAKPPNRWDRLPSYWDAEVDAVSRVR
jgi:hypothetical protein